MSAAALQKPVQSHQGSYVAASTLGKPTTRASARAAGITVSSSGLSREGAKTRSLKSCRTYSAKHRAQLLQRREQLPPTARRPPHRCPNQYVLERLGPTGKLVAPAKDWLVSRRDWLKDRAQAYIDAAGPHWPEDHNRSSTLVSMVKQTCSSKRSKYSLHSLVASLHRQLQTADGFATLCARDCYSKAHAAKYFQLNLTLGLIDNMDDDGVELPKVPVALAACSICLSRVKDCAEWCQLEPCRHFLCACCTDELIRTTGGQQCPECRKAVIDFVDVKRPARLSRRILEEAACA